VLRLDQFWRQHTSCVQPDICFHKGFNPSSEVGFVLRAKDMDLLRREGDGSGGSRCGRDDFEDEFTAPSKTDLSRGTR